MGESARYRAQWLRNALSLWELHLCKSCRCLKHWLERKTNTKLSLYDTIRNFLKHRCLKRPCIVHLDLICMSYNQRKGRESNWEFDSWSQTPWNQGSNDLIRACYTSLRRYIWGLQDSSLVFSKYIWFEKDTSVQSLETTRVPILGLPSPLGSPREKWHLDVIPTKRHKVYYREGNGASSQRLRAV
jgi:hypothetical protein